MSEESAPTLAQRGILTRDQLSKQFNKTKATLRLWEKAGMPVIKHGKTRLYVVDDVVEWLKKQSTSAA